MWLLAWALFPRCAESQMSQTFVLWGRSWREDPGHTLGWLPGSGSTRNSLGDAETQRQGRRWGGQIREGMNGCHEEQLHFLLTCPPALSSVKLFWAGPKSQWPLCFSPKALSRTSHMVVKSLHKAGWLVMTGLLDSLSPTHELQLRKGTWGKHRLGDHLQKWLGFLFFFNFSFCVCGSWKIIWKWREVSFRKTIWFLVTWINVHLFLECFPQFYWGIIDIHHCIRLKHRAWWFVKWLIVKWLPQ